MLGHSQKVFNNFIYLLVESRICHILFMFYILCLVEFSSILQLLSGMFWKEEERMKWS